MNAVALRAHVESVLAKRCPAPFAPLRQKLNEKIPTGIAELDLLTAGGLPQGELSEICGPASSGRTSLMLALMAEVTGRGDLCALVDVHDNFAPDLAAPAGVDLGWLLWVRCGGKKAGGELQRVEQGMRAVDLLLESGGFTLVIFDLADVSLQAARRIPLASWFRFRKAVEHKSTAFVVMEDQPHARSCAALVLSLSRSSEQWAKLDGEEHPAGTLLREISCSAAVARGKPMSSIPSADFRLGSRWAV
jgi:recombination protein RecA